MVNSSIDLSFIIKASPLHTLSSTQNEKNTAWKYVLTDKANIMLNSFFVECDGKKSILRFGNAESGDDMRVLTKTRLTVSGVCL